MRTFVPDFPGHIGRGKRDFFFSESFLLNLMTVEKVLIYGPAFQGRLKTFSSLLIEERLPFLTPTEGCY